MWRRTRASVDRRRALAAGLASVLLAGCGSSATAAHSNALWHVVHDLCVPDRRWLGLAAPCLSVDLRRGVAVVPDPGSPTQILLTPTRRIAGIESPELTAPGAPNYWQAAWEARGRLADRLGGALPREAVALAVNSIAGRSQDQLHIHIDCLRPDVREALAAEAPPSDWRELTIGGGRWHVRSVRGADLGPVNPFQLLADAPFSASTARGSWTLVVVGARLAEDRPGFYVLARAADPVTGYKGHGEYLLDKSCKQLTGGAAGS